MSASEASGPLVFLSIVEETGLSGILLTLNMHDW